MPPLLWHEQRQTVRGRAPAVVHDGLAVYDLGAGPPVLVTPGPHRYARTGLRSFDVLLDGLRRLGCRVLTFDPPASGASSRPARLGMEEMHDCADEALEVCGVATPVDVVGHSMGGLAALAYAIERPDRVRRLVLIGTGSGGPAYTKAPGALWNRTHPRFARLALLGSLHLLWPARGPERLLRNLVERTSFVDPSQARTAPVHLADWLRPREGRPDWHRIASKLDYAPRIGEIVVPTLVLCGRHDPQYPPACSEQLVHSIPHARLVWFDRSGHHPHIEEPDRFWTTVERFLTSGPPG